MTARTRTRGAARRTAVLSSLLLGASALLALGGSGVAQATAAPPTDTSADCVSAGPEARAFPGGTGADRSSMSLQQSLAWDAALQQKVKDKGLLSRAKAPRLGGIVIDVRVHVITRDDGSGGVTRAQVDNQIRVLNTAYAGRGLVSAPTPFRFRITSYDVTANTDWYDWSSPDVDINDEIEAKTALHQGGYDDLNMYITGLQDNLLGYAYYPTDQVGVLDGVVLLNDSLPGGTAVPYNEGDTATHEIGHWLNLAHTFENGCQSPGDFVADTPYQADGDNIFECNESLNTCPQIGRDPVHNYMSYGDDPCLDRFTAGQSLRMTLSWLAYRQP